MPDAFAITVIFIVLSTLIAALIRGRKRDKCLKDFSDNMVTIYKTNGNAISGKLRVENTGMELTFNRSLEDSHGPQKTSYILYKYEFPNIQTLIRYHAHLSEQNKRQRQEQLQKTYHPTATRRFQRKIQNLFKTIRDSIAEVVNLLISRAKKTTTVGTTLTSQDKYVAQMKSELMGSVGTSFEPLLERYIGHKVVLELIKGDKLVEYSGVLKDYTADFLEIMDVDYEEPAQASAKKADLVVLRKYGLIRNLAE